MDSSYANDPPRQVLLNRQIYRRCIWFHFSTLRIVYAFAIQLSVCLHFILSCRLSSETPDGYMSQPGDIVIGGTFMVHLKRVYNDFSFTRNPTELQCQFFNIEYYQNMHAFLFAIEEINLDPDLLPNVTLGFHIYDTCYTIRKSAQGTFSILSGGREMIPNYNCHTDTPLAGFVGDSWSTSSILMAQILGLYRYPQISYFATNPILSNRDLFPSFFRTIPSDDVQMIGLAQLVSHFGWSWVGLLVSNNDYGQYGLLVAKKEIIKGGACVAFAETILFSQTNKNVPRLAKVIKESTAKVVVVIASDFLVVVEELLKQNITGNIFVASETWATSALLSTEKYKGILLGTIGFAIHQLEMPKFSRYLESLNSTKPSFDIFVKEYWEQAFSCKWILQDNASTWIKNDTINKCSGNERIQLNKDYRLSINIYNAVYSIAWALQDLFDCIPGTGPFNQHTCANISSFQPWELLYYIKNVNFKTKDGNKVFFDREGNPPSVYDIVNWHLSVKGTLEQVVVGSYGLNVLDGKTLNLDGTQIIWSHGNSQVPISKCSPSCLKGFRKLIVPEQPPCCYECTQCPQGQISNITDAVECHPCSWDMWPNLQQDRCLPKSIEFLSYEEPLGYILAAITLVSSLVPIIILDVFICYKKTPIVRANNYSLSCLLLVSLFFCFLSSLGFIGYPQPEKCLLRQVTFGVVFTLCISCVLAKTVTVIIAFNATKPDSRLRRWSGVKVSYCLLGFCVFIQLCLCLTWLICSPPFSQLNTESKPGIIIVECDEGLLAAFWCMLGYLGFLATISFIVAFLARTLPDSFNEAKYITFSMLAFISVWVSFIPAYLSSSGKYSVAMEIFAILCSIWAVVLCIFAPKCFIILFRPDMNSREHLMGKNQIQK